MISNKNHKNIKTGQSVKAKWNDNSKSFRDAIVLGIVQYPDEQYQKLILRFFGYYDFKEIPLTQERVQLTKLLNPDEIKVNVSKLVLMILNKISGTQTETFEKQVYNNLSKFRFLEILIEDDNPETCLIITQVITKKSQLEASFNDLYCHLCIHLCEKNNTFEQVFKNFINEQLSNQHFQISPDAKHKYIGFFEFLGKLFKKNMISEKQVSKFLIIFLSTKINQEEIYVEVILKFLHVITPRNLDSNRSLKTLLMPIYSTITNFYMGTGPYILSKRIQYLCLNYLERNDIRKKKIKVLKRN